MPVAVGSGGRTVVGSVGVSVRGVPVGVSVRGVPVDGSACGSVGGVSVDGSVGGVSVSVSVSGGSVGGAVSGAVSEAVGAVLVWRFGLVAGSTRLFLFTVILLVDGFFAPFTFVFEPTGRPRFFLATHTVNTALFRSPKQLYNS